MNTPAHLERKGVESEKEATLLEMEKAVALIFNNILEESDRIKGFMAVIEDIQALLESIIQGDLDTAEKYVVKFSGLGEKELFVEVGKITRKLHDSIKEFQEAIRPRLITLPVSELPQANDKLEWVISKTEEAAGRTLGLVEKHLGYLKQCAPVLPFLEGWLKAERLPEGVDRRALEALVAMNRDLSKDLTEIMMAQDFQDLTGQIIKKVIALIAEIERHLVKILRIFGLKLESATGGISDDPSTRGVRDDIVTGQSDVDDILKQFGF